MGAVTQGLRWASEGLSRRVAAFALLVFLAFQIGVPALLSTPRLTLFDAYQRWAPRHRAPSAAPVVLVAVDDVSLAALGQWPWRRSLEAKLVRDILAGSPAALGVDVIWSESAAGVRAAAGDDAALAAAIAEGPVAIGVVGSGQAESGPAAACRDAAPNPGPFAPVILAGQARFADRAPCFLGDLRSVTVIDQAAPGHGVISNEADPDHVFRHLRLLSAVGGRVAPDLSLEVYRLAARAPVITLYPARDGPGVRGIGVGPSTFPTEPDGALWIDYTPRDEWPVIHASDVIAGRVRPGAFDGRLVLVGVTAVAQTAVGQADQLRQTPVGPMSGLEVNAQGLENLVAGKLAHRPPWAPGFEAALTLVVGLFLIVVLPGARPAWRVLAAALPFLLLAVGGPLAWTVSRALVDVASPAIGGGVVLVALLGGGLVDVDAQRRRLRREVELGRIASARAEGELEAGRRIQMGILPAPESLAPDGRFDLDALMVPARQIGGDLYDFFKIDPDRLFIAVGDVSGKGLPASLFMALGKSLCKSCALRGETDIGAIVQRANAEISRDNPEMLFITLFAGILDLRTGELSFCNAGHDAPFLLRDGAPPSAVPADGGPPLCVADDFPYATEICRLTPGDILCLTTDGVTEAMTRAGELMGRDRVNAVLAATNGAATAREVTRGLQASVADFVAGADPSDDLTILTIRWNGPGSTSAVEDAAARSQAPLPIAAARRA